MAITDLPAQHFRHDGVSLAYYTAGDGDPILLVHGFASTAKVNWLHTGWVETLVRSGRMVVLIDNRGHGASEKLYEVDAYHTDRMADDAAALLDHLGIRQADVMGYSMGARIGAFLASRHPFVVHRLILGGLGNHLVDGVGLPLGIADALEAPDRSTVTDPQGRTFRLFAEQTKSDLRALAACIRGSRNVLSEADVRAITQPVLVAIGTKDDVAGDPHSLAAMFPNGHALPITDRDHMTAVGDKIYKAGVLAFLDEH